MSPPLFVTLICLLFALVPLVHSQNGTNTTLITFGTITVCNCQPSNNTSNITKFSYNNVTTPTTINYTLTVPSWPLTPALQFVIVIRRSRGSSEGEGEYYPISAEIGSTSWSVLSDSQTSDAGEIWVPMQAPGTVVNVVVTCSFPASYTIEPVIPNAITGLTGVQNFNFMATTDDVTPHAHWWAVSVDKDALGGYLWSELCQVPNVSSLFTLRVVFPGINVTDNTCLRDRTNAYSLSSGATNFHLTGYVSLAISWLGTLAATTTVFYVSVYAIDATSHVIPISFNVYLLNTNAPIPFYGSANGAFTAHAIQLRNDLFVASIDGGYYPTETEEMELYFLYTEEQDNLNATFFASACYLKRQAQSALFRGKLVNGSHDYQLSKSSVGIVKAPAFFAGRTNATSSPVTFALTYSEYMVLPTIQGFSSIDVPSNSNVLLGVVIVLAVLAGILLLLAVVLAMRLRKQGYDEVPH